MAVYTNFIRSCFPLFAPFFFFFFYFCSQFLFSVFYFLFSVAVLCSFAGLCVCCCVFVCCVSLFVCLMSTWPRHMGSWSCSCGSHSAACIAKWQVHPGMSSSLNLKRLIPFALLPSLAFGSKSESERESVFVHGEKKAA